ncbi:hypothetical protein [Ketogulonicigenium vulgare]|uniref:Lipoprotein n=1 Tax=Ketogulonicigenium vulgare (strain WSH-001) TaxID=759362 RepID=F9Y7K7_KETVW|nr:hypothetical protein [Ketogulonicigenium vulgare]ADO41314.1 conserved hypothetical protein [Ketogulonicigenium vulgare Y25]AEM42303.1 hypothetical protein KVU_2464 [Ketogulonicigenium vulgare WSH-001]ALJ79920.1 hypothetical protein KVH_01160 [Ketogulonicigenium vulgare]ANW34836.1 hypothetical protein KvSKV_01165 [Ketogulonicigenium vulgare]AOZ53140.1 hypothetical protein KVC_0113 [Ketogulonicigenium vulgare]
MRAPALALLGFVTLTACGAAPSGNVDIVAATAYCEQRARAAMGPTGGVTVGFNNRSGPSAEVELGVNTDFLRGRDPMQVYDECVRRRTGFAPYRPPAL